MARSREVTRRSAAGVRFAASGLALIAVTLTACGGSGPSGTTDPVRLTGPTIAPGQTVPHAATSERQDVSPACEVALKPLRALMERYEHGQAVEAPDDRKLTEALGAATDASTGAAPCSSEEWDRFYRLEFDAWLVPGR